MIYGSFFEAGVKVYIRLIIPREDIVEISGIEREYEVDLVIPLVHRNDEDDVFMLLP